MYLLTAWLIFQFYLNSNIYLMFFYGQIKFTDMTSLRDRDRDEGSDCKPHFKLIQDKYCF